ALLRRFGFSCFVSPVATAGTATSEGNQSRRAKHHHTPKRRPQQNQERNQSGRAKHCRTPHQKQPKQTEKRNQSGRAKHCRTPHQNQSTLRPVGNRHRSECGRASVGKASSPAPASPSARTTLPSTTDTGWPPAPDRA